MKSEWKVPASANTPEVDFSVNQKIQSVIGLSTPIDSFEFYRPLIQWIENHQDQLPLETVFRFELNYFNSSSMKALLWLIQAIANGIASGKKWTIHWVISEEDEFMEEAGESFQALVDVPIELVKV